MIINAPIGCIAEQLSEQSSQRALHREPITPTGKQFQDIITIIETARTRALKAVNAEMIRMYWAVGEYLSGLCANSAFGDKVIDEVAAFIAKENPGVKGFTRRGLYRMKQFYETYRNDEFVSAVLTLFRQMDYLRIRFSFNQNGY